jgi:Tfp pilus assembly protein PilN
MTQQINLYGAQFRPVRDPLPAVRLLGIAAAALVVVGALWGWTGWRLTEARQQANGLREELARSQAEVTAVSKAVGARRTDAKLEQELARAESMYRARTELKALLDSGALGTPGGFSEPMRALARQSAAGLWLTGFTLGGGQVELRGRALSADLVPAYLRRLSQEKALSGVALNALRIDQPALDRNDGATTRSAAGAAAASGTTASGTTVAGTTGPAGSAAGMRPSGPAFVEFQVVSDARSLGAERGTR